MAVDTVRGAVFFFFFLLLFFFYKSQIEETVRNSSE